MSAEQVDEIARNLRIVGGARVHLRWGASSETMCGAEKKWPGWALGGKPPRRETLSTSAAVTCKACPKSAR